MQHGATWMINLTGYSHPYNDFAPSNGVSYLRIYRHHDPPTRFDIEPTSTKGLKKVAISQHGIVALLCHSTVNIVDLHNQDTGSRTSHREPIPDLLKHPSGAIVTDIEFDQTGRHLFTWAYGPKAGYFSVWDLYHHDGVVKAEKQLEREFVIVSRTDRGALHCNADHYTGLNI